MTSQGQAQVKVKAKDRSCQVRYRSGQVRSCQDNSGQMQLEQFVTISSLDKS